MIQDGGERSDLLMSDGDNAETFFEHGIAELFDILHGDFRDEQVRMERDELFDGTAIFIQTF